MTTPIPAEAAARPTPAPSTVTPARRVGPFSPDSDLWRAPEIWGSATVAGAAAIGAPLRAALAPDTRYVVVFALLGLVLGVAATIYLAAATVYVVRTWRGRR
jgi:hypothetical protein